MVTLKLLVCAQSAALDGDTKEVSLFNLLDSVTAVGFPLLLQNMAVLAIFHREQADPNTINVRFGLLHNDELMAPESTVRLAFEDKLRMRQVFRISGLVVPAPGRLEARLSLDQDQPNVLTASYIVDFDVAQPPQVQVAGGG
jgi:hypothetical protein